MSDEQIGKGATTLDWLRVRYEWLGVMIDETEAKITSLTAERDGLLDLLVRPWLKVWEVSLPYRQGGYEGGVMTGDMDGSEPKIGETEWYHFKDRESAIKCLLEIVKERQ